MEYTEKMHHDEVGVIEDSDAVPVHDTESGYMNR